TAARSMQRVIGKTEIGFTDFFQIHLCREIPKVSGPDIDGLNERVVWFRREVPIRLLELDDFFFDFRSYLGKGGRTIGRGKFQAVVFSGIVAGGDVDCAVELLANDGER